MASNVLRLATTGADVALLTLLKRFVDHGLAGGGPRFSLVAWALGLTAAREIAAYGAGRLAVGSATGLIGDLQNRLFEHLHTLSLSFHRKHRPADLMERLFHDVERATNLVTGVTATAVEMPVRLLGMFALLWSLHPRMAVGIAGVLIPAVILGRLLARTLRRAYHGLSEELSGLYHTAYESLGTIELLQSYDGSAHTAAGFAARNRALVERQTTLHRKHALQGPVSQGLRLLAVLLAFTYGSSEIAAGRLTPGGFAAILVAAYVFLGSIDSFVGLYSIAQGGLASAERVFEVLDAAPSITSPPGAPAATFQQEIRFEDVVFAYAPGGPAALDHVSFALRPGDHLAVVGPSGSGKTTLMRLLLRLHDPQAGRITFDGIDARALDLASLRALFAVAPQEGLIVDLTIGENVALGRKDAARADIEAAAHAAGLGPRLASLPEGLGTRVGRGGASLSGGERQRVALARAALRNAPVLLLDEATSAIDNAGEDRLQDWLRATSRTCVTIAHRLSTLRGATCTLTLDGGRARLDRPAPTT